MDQIVPSRSEREAFDTCCLSRRRPCGERDDKSRVAPAASRTVPSSCVACIPSTRRRDVAGNGRRSFSTGRKTCGKRPGARLTAQVCIRHATWRCKPHRTAADGCARNCASEHRDLKCVGAFPGGAPTRHCPRRPRWGLFIETPGLLLCPPRLGKVAGEFLRCARQRPVELRKGHAASCRPILASPTSVAAHNYLCRQ